MIYSNADPGLTLTYFKARSNFLTFAFLSIGKSENSGFFQKLIAAIISRRDSPVRGQIYLLKIASIYGHFTPIGGVKWLFLGIFRKLSLCKRLWIIR